MICNKLNNKTMTQEEKDLLIIDLCGRIPYGLICKSNSYKYILFNSSHISLIESEEIKPYPICNYDAIDWLNAHHFDYRGLIEKDLALEAPENIYIYIYIYIYI